MKFRCHSVPILLPVVVMLGACTTQSWYEGFRLSGEQECRKQPPGTYDDCLSRINRQSFDEYTRARSAQ